jgi:tetratricopeptide (TPR) repeat protein/transcriptional regulator with XRE-family HTH domain
MTSQALPSFGDLLRQHRLEAGLSQEELAEVAGISARAISDLERGARHRPYRATVGRLAQALGLAEEDRLQLERAARVGVYAVPELDLGPTLPDGTDHGSGHTETSGRQQLPMGGFAGSLPVGPVVGREVERAHLQTAVDAVAQGEGRLILLAGETGAGKTRLLQEATVTALERGVLVAAGRCYEPEQTVPYYPFLDVVATLWGIAPADLRADAAERWPYLGVLLPERLAVPSVSAGPAQDTQQRVFRAVTGFLEMMAESASILLLLDDLHWADGTSLTLLRHIATHTRSCRLLLLGTYRDAEVGRHHPLEGALLDLGREGLVDTIPVRRLPEVGTAALIGVFLDEEEVSPGFAALVHSRTEGNPYFIAQVVRDLVESGDIVRRDGCWDRKAMDELAVPAKIRVTVGQRVSKLPILTQRVLHEASVLGQTFRFDDLQAMGSRGEEDLEEALAEGIDAALIQDVDGERFTFDHALTQQALYEDLLVRRRRTLHRAAAAAIEGGAERERASELAWHLLHGNDTAGALPYLLEAGRQADAVFAYVEAEKQYRTALALARDLGRQQDEAEALDRLGRVLRMTGRHDDALEALEQAAAIHHGAGDLEREVATVTVIAETHYWRASQAEGVARVEAFLETLEGRTPPPGTARLLAYQVGNTARSQQSTLAELMAQCERVIELARAEGDTSTFVFAEGMRGFGLRNLGRIEEAIQVQEAVEPLAERQGDEDSLNMVMMLAENYLFAGRFAQARARLTGSIGHYERRGQDGMVAYCLAHIGTTYLGEGDWQQARSWFEQALYRREPYKRSWSSISALVSFGRLAVYEGRWTEAERLLDEAMTMARANQDGQWVAVVHHLLSERDRLRGQPDEAFARHERLMADPEQAPKLTSGPSPALAMVYLAAGDVDRADELVESGIRLVGENGLDIAIWDWIALRASVLAARGRWAESEAAFLDALTRVRRTRYVFYEAQALQWHGEMLAAHGEVERAQERLLEARAIYARVGAAPYLAQTDEALKQLPH